MADFIKSAFDYFGSSGKSKGTNELIGNNIEIGNQIFKIVSIIAEGGFSVVYQGQDGKSNLYAVKRLLSHDAETNKEIMREIEYLKKLSGHPNIIRLYTAASIGQERQKHIGTEFLIVTEYCTGGQLIQLMLRRNKPFPYEICLQIFNHVLKAVEHLHNLNPPLIHRDLKVENLLISDRAVVKLCDFGSATTETHFPDNSWTGLQRAEVQEEIEKHTTPMYRAPEMLDLYQNYPIDQACDIWALGCVLYYLCINRHPFEDSAKLAILNAKYTIPSYMKVNERLYGLIFQMLLVDPRQRPKISEIISEIRVQALSSNTGLRQSIIFDKESLTHLPNLPVISEERSGSPVITNESVHNLSDRQPAPERPPPPPLPSARKNQTNITSPVHNVTVDSSKSTVHNAIPSVKNQPVNSVQTHSSGTPLPGSDGRKMFGMLKEGAGHLMKNIKDASSKVIEQVSSTMNKTELDITYVTSRIIIMPTPGETGMDAVTRDKVDDIHTFLEFRHPKKYFIYNLSLRTIKSEKFKGKIIQKGYDSMKIIPFPVLVELLFHQRYWLSQDSANIIVIQCGDGKVLSSFCVAALLCFCRFVDHSFSALKIVQFRRGDCSLTSSQLRYIDYVSRLVNAVNIGTDDTNLINKPHRQLIKLTGLVVKPIPLFNRSRTGFRPLIEIFCDFKLVYSNIKNYEDLSLFTEDQQTATIQLPDVPVYGDINIVLYHTRSNIVSKGKLSTLKICEFHLYSGYLDKCNDVNLVRKQLDHLDFDLERYPKGFNITLNLVITNNEAPRDTKPLIWNSEDFNSQMNNYKTENRFILFGSREEMKACLTSTNVKIAKVPKVDDEKKLPNEKFSDKNFFQTLDWAEDEKYNDDKNKNLKNDDNKLTVENSDFEGDEYDDLNTEEKVGDLLGDFNASNDDDSVTGVDNREEPNQDSQQAVDGLVDFLSAFPVSSGNKDNNSQIMETSDTSNVNLLMFSFPTEENNLEINDDPFNSHCNNQTDTQEFAKFDDILSSQSNLFVSTSTSNLTTPTPANVNPTSDWSNLLFNDNISTPALKPSSSASNLLKGINISSTTTTSTIKPSPSFTSSFNTTSDTVKSTETKREADFDLFDNLTKNKLSSGPSGLTPPSVKSKPNLNPNLTNINSKKDAPQKQKIAFEELLGDFKPQDCKNSGNGNSGKSMKEMRRANKAKTTDPETLLVLDWIEGKERNIRALLCSLNSILWEGIRWNGVNMAELVTVDQVKRAYKNAIRCVHPDKWNNTEKENLARLIMIELNDAMTEFEEERNAS